MSVDTQHDSTQANFYNNDVLQPSIDPTTQTPKVSGGMTPRNMEVDSVTYKSGSLTSTSNSGWHPVPNAAHTLNVVQDVGVDTDDQLAAQNTSERNQNPPPSSTGSGQSTSIQQAKSFGPAQTAREVLAWASSTSRTGKRREASYSPRVQTQRGTQRFPSSRSKDINTPLTMLERLLPKLSARR